MNISRGANYLARHGKQARDRILRVNHAGELGADRIYQGQMAILGQDPIYGDMIQKMWNQEKKHLRYFEKEIAKTGASRSMLTPLWSAGGFALGAVTAALGPSAAMACTAAVERVITGHYDGQLREMIGSADKSPEFQRLIDTIKEFRDEEEEHHQTGMEHHNEKEHATLHAIVKQLCNVAIAIASRV